MRSLNLVDDFAQATGRNASDSDWPEVKFQFLWQLGIEVIVYPLVMILTPLPLHYLFSALSF